MPYTEFEFASISSFGDIASRKELVIEFGYIFTPGKWDQLLKMSFYANFNNFEAEENLFILKIFQAS